jgi:mannose-6-phosphate isomerase
MATKLKTELVEKPWGVEALPPMFGTINGERVGEVWFTGERELPLLAKYIFTSEKLSIQVHPTDAQAQELGAEGGKHECWLILQAEEEATIGIGLTRDITSDEMRSAALDGSIEELIDWRPVKAGDFFYVPAGTVHAIGAGVSLLEFQQNGGVTFRLYDYGRPRELHLDEAISVARPEPYPPSLHSHVDTTQDKQLVDGPIFSLVHVASGDGSVLQGKRRWIMPLTGVARAGGHEAAPGECLVVEAGEIAELNGARVLIGA